MSCMIVAVCAGVPDSKQHRSEPCPNGTGACICSHTSNRAALMSLVWYSDMRHLLRNPAGELSEQRPV